MLICKTQILVQCFALLNSPPYILYAYRRHKHNFYVSSGNFLNKINLENNKSNLKFTLKTPQSIQLLLLMLDVPETLHLPFFCLLDGMRLEGNTHTMNYSYEYIISSNVVWSLIYEYKALLLLCCKLFLFFYSRVIICLIKI